MKSLELKYGCNPNQKPARVFMENSKDLPFEVLNGRAGYINLLDAFNAWQLVKELSEATGEVAAASFKHVSPTSAAIGRSLNEKLRKIYFVEDVEDIDKSPLALAYARARGTDRMSSFGDFIALSSKCDEITAKLIAREVSDGVIAPDYEPESLERKQVYGISFEQGRNNYKISDKDFENIVSKNKNLSKEAKLNLTLALITLKYTQSNSVCFAKDGQAIGVGAGQQSRIHCTRLAGDKADIWHLRQADKVLGLKFKQGIGRADRDNVIDLYISDNSELVLKEGVWQSFFETKPGEFTKEEKKTYLAQVDDVCLASDAFFPFGDNIDRAKLSGVKYVVEPGGSVRDDNVIEKADEYDMVLCFNGMRLFHH